jgi:acetyl-CoA carboxylase carboxyltransferase component
MLQEQKDEGWSTRGIIDVLEQERSQALQGGGQRRIDAQHKQGKITACVVGRR